MTNVFISRDLSPDSVFKQLLEGQGLNVIGQSLIECTPVAFGECKAVDWLFFYSKNGVRYFFEGLKQPLLPSIRFATMGLGTASILQKYGYTVDFIGTGHPVSTASAFLKVAKQQRVLFPRAKNSQKSIQGLLGTTIKMEEVVVYANNPKSHFHIPYCGYLVFTSPLNAQAYFSEKTLKQGQNIIAIGNTTATALKKMGAIDIYRAAYPSEKAMAELVLTIQQRTEDRPFH